MIEEEAAGTDPMVELAVCASQYEASLLEALLDQAGIPFEASAMSSQFAFTAGQGSTSIRVRESDLQAARRVVEIRDDNPEEVEETEEELQADVVARRQRRYKIARLFVGMTGIAYLAVAFLALAAGVAEASLHAAVGLVLAWVLFASYRNPRVAFLVSFLVTAAATIGAIYTDRILLILPGIGVLLSSYGAHVTAKQTEESPSEKSPG